MKKVGIILIVIAVIAQTSCAGARVDYLSCFEGAFRCEFAYRSESLEYRAALYMGKGEIKLSFLEPESLCGIEVSRREGQTLLELSDISINGGAAEAFLSVTRFFEFETEVISAERTLKNNEEYELIRVGNKRGDICELLFVPSTRLPARISSNGAEIHIISFEGLE